MPRQRFNFWLDDDLRAGLQAVRDRDGIVESEQIRRAIRAWLRTKRVTPAKPKRASGAAKSGAAAKRKRS